MIIKDKMAVICRTEEEQEIYIETAINEGWKTSAGNRVTEMRKPPVNYATGYWPNEIYPNAISYGMADKEFPPHLTVVEASVLFRNQLIARRKRNEKRTN